MNKSIYLLLLLSFAMSLNAATTVDGGSFTNVADAITSWSQGSLGYIIALLGTFGSIIWYLIGEGVMGGSGKALFVGILVSFFAGGLVGIVQTMMKIGNGAF